MSSNIKFVNINSDQLVSTASELEDAFIITNEGDDYGKLYYSNSNQEILKREVKAKTPNKLTINNGDETVDFDGSESVELNVSNVSTETYNLTSSGFTNTVTTNFTTIFNVLTLYGGEIVECGVEISGSDVSVNFAGVDVSADSPIVLIIYGV